MDARSLIDPQDAPLIERLVAEASSRDIELHLVGGYLRDRLLGRSRPDIDLVTQGDPTPLARAMGGAVVPLDPEHGVVRVVKDGFVLDFTRRQAETIEDDLWQRDLSINALALPLHPPGSLLDPTDGVEDLAARRVRVPRMENLLADPVRILRVFRFAAVLGFEIDFQTLLWVETYKRKLLDTAAERITAELAKILAGKHVRWVQRLYGIGILGILIPELHWLRRLPKGPTGLDAVSRAIGRVAGLEDLLPDGRFEEILAADRPQAVMLKLGALLLEIGKPFVITHGLVLSYPEQAAEGARRAEAIAERLRLSSKESSYLSAVLRLQDQPAELVDGGLDPAAVYRFVKEAREASPGIVALAKADARVNQLPDDRRRLEEGLDRLESLLADPRVANPPRYVDGKRLMAELGLKPGPELGRILEAIAEATARGQIASAEEAIAYARSFSVDPA